MKQFTFGAIWLAVLLFRQQQSACMPMCLFLAIFSSTQSRSLVVSFFIFFEWLSQKCCDYGQSSLSMTFVWFADIRLPVLSIKCFLTFFNLIVLHYTSPFIFTYMLVYCSMDIFHLRLFVCSVGSRVIAFYILS